VGKEGRGARAADVVWSRYLCHDRDYGCQTVVLAELVGRILEGNEISEVLRGQNGCVFRDFLTCSGFRV
jgi:hypothetical protein